MKKFKVGDKVRATSELYGVTTESLGWEGIVTNAWESGYFDTETTKCLGGCIGHEFLHLNPKHFKLITPETIVIASDGKTTTAWLKQGKTVLKTAVAKCSPEDEFNLEIGAKLALNRLFGVECVKQDHYKVGDKIKLKDCFKGLGNLVPEMLEWQGKVVTVGREYKDGARIVEDDRKWFWNNHFIEGKVKEKEEPKKEYPKYKVGDRVKIVSRKTGTCWNPDGQMDRWLGKTMTIARLCGDGSDRYCTMKEDASTWIWYPWMIEGLAKPLVIKREGKECGIVGTPTGLKDISGKDLFVGDIVRVIGDNSGCLVYMVEPLENEFQPSGYGLGWKKNGASSDGSKIEKLVDWTACEAGDKLNNCQIEEK